MGRTVPLGFVLVLLSPCVTTTGQPTRQAAAKLDAPKAKIDYVAKLNELVKKGSDESQNADPFYRKAFELCVTLSSDVDVKPWPTELADEQRSMLKKWVETNSEALVQVRLGTQRPSYWFQYHGGDMWSIIDPGNDLAKMRAVCAGLVLRAKFRAVEGDTEHAVEDLVTGLRFGTDIRKRLMLLEQLAGIGYSGASVRAGFLILDRTTVSPTVLESLQRQLVDLAKRDDRPIDLRGEELLALDSIQRVYAHWRMNLNKKSMEVLAKSMAQELLAQLGTDLTEQEIYTVYSHTREEVADLARRAYAYYSSVATQTPFQWKREIAFVEKDCWAMTGGHPVLRIVAPNAAGAAELLFRHRACRDALITTVALLRYKNNEHVFPIDVKELVSAGYLSQLPMDPYSDGPLVYRRTERSFLLYSVGVDFTDNGARHSPKWGREPQKGDYVFWPVQADSKPED